MRVEKSDRKRHQRAKQASNALHTVILGLYARISKPLDQWLNANAWVREDSDTNMSRFAYPRVEADKTKHRI